MENIPGTAVNPCSATRPAFNRILRLPEVINRVGLSRSSIYAMIADGCFPRQYALSERAVGWLESDVDVWVRGRIQGNIIS